jgi:hypothetical protein
MPAPQVSVLIPSYNQARFLPAAMASVLEQDFPDFEVVIVDDASRDDSAEIIARWAARDGRIRHEINAANLGQAGNLNRCLELARGRYVKFVFADDRLASRSALGKLVTLLSGAPGAVMAASARYVIDPAGRRVDVWDRCGPAGRQSGRAVIARCLEQGCSNLIGEPSVVLIRKEALRRGFNPAFNQLVDLEMWLSLLEHGDLVYTRECLAEFRRHPGQITAASQQSGAGAREALLLLDQYRQREWLPEAIRRRVTFQLAHRLRRQTMAGLPERRQLLRELGRFRYFLLWLGHRFTKPARSLCRFISSRLKLMLAPAHAG